jgi:hypothetical protein
LYRSRVAASGNDYEFPYNLKTATQEDLYQQIYLYLKLWHNIPNQVDGFLDDIAQVKDTAGPLFLSAKIDVEENDGMSINSFLSALDGVISKLRKGYDGILEIYTSASKMNRFLGKSKSDLVKNTLLHVSHFFTGIDIDRVPLVRPYIPDVWALINNPVEPAWWQVDTYDGGFDWGSNGDNEIDMSFFTYGGGTYEAFKKLYKVDLPVAVPPVPAPAGEYAIITINQSSIRYAPLFTPPNAADNLFAKAISGRKVKLLPTETVVNGYRPIVAYIWDKNIKKI